MMPRRKEKLVEEGRKYRKEGRYFFASGVTQSVSITVELQLWRVRGMCGIRES